MNLGENIYKLRIAKNLSQEDLASALEVSRQSVSKWENNSAVPELDKLVKMARLFEVSLDELVSGAEAAPQTVPEKKTYPPIQKILGVLFIALALLMVCLAIVIPDVSVEGVIYFGLILVTGGVACLWPLRHFSNIWIFTLDGLFLVATLHAPQSTMILSIPFLLIFIVQCWRAGKS